MGYDLYVVNPPQEAVDKAEDAKRNFQEAVNRRDAFERGSVEAEKAQKEVVKWYDLMMPVETYWRYNIWGMSIMRRIMHDAGVSSDILNKFGSNDGYLVTPEDCREIASCLRTFATRDADGIHRMHMAMAQGDMPSEFEVRMVALIGAMPDASTFETPAALGAVPTDVQTLDEEGQQKLAKKVAEWLVESEDFAQFCEGAADCGGFEVY